MGPFGVVGDEPVIERLLHLADGLKPSLAALDAEVLGEHGAVEALDDAVGLWPAHPDSAVFDSLQLDASKNLPIGFVF